MLPNTGAYSLTELITKRITPPSSAGVYIFRDAAEQVLYIGKANNLRARINSYLHDEGVARPWIGVMLKSAASVETIVVKSSLEALLLEQTLIKKHRPKYNTLLVDDKSYPYIKLVKDGQYPRLQITRKLDDPKASYFGPYLSGYDASLTLALIRKVYGIHQSAKPIIGNWPRPCLNCQLENGRCPFSGEARADLYELSLTKAVKFLRGKRRAILVDLKRKMKEASVNQNFELARYLRDYLRASQAAVSPQGVISPRGMSYLALGIAVSSAGDDRICIVVDRFEKGSLTSQRKYFFLSRGEPSEETLRAFLVGHLPTLEQACRFVAVPIKLTDSEEIEASLSELWHMRVKVTHPQRGSKLDSIERACRNAEVALAKDAPKAKNYSTALEQLAQLLGLVSRPKRIEVVDISNLGKSGAVGAVICMIDGEFRKSEYRRYRIKTIEGQNDFGMIQEVTMRRFQDTSRPAPDMFVVDGGPEQLKAAKRGIESASSSPGALISIAKSPDRVYVNNCTVPLETEDYPQALQLLARARDEAHRFAVSYHRKTRKIA